MGEQRRIGRRGNSWVVPVPRAIRAHLRRLDGGDVFWHLGAAREAHVTSGAQRIGGKPPGARLDRDLDQARREIERLRARIAARPTAVYNEGVNEGRMQHMGELVKLGAALDTLIAEVRALADRLPFTRRTRPARAARPQPSDVIPTPVLSPPSEASDEGDAASGAQRVP
jgi:hypothetical protein